MLQFDAAGDASHEGLGVLGESLEDADKIAQSFVDFRHVADCGLHIVLDQGLEGEQPAGDVFQCHGLQLGSAAQHLDESGQGRLDGFAAER